MHLLARIHRYLRRTAVPPTTFGRMVLNDPRFVEDLRRGREVRPRTEARVHAWLDARGETR